MTEERESLITNTESSSIISPAEAQQNYGSISRIAAATNSSSNETNEEMTTTISSNDNKTTLNFLQKAGYSLGHVFNDLCAGIWFSYTLLFFQGVILMDGPLAGAMMMLGQVGDAIFTPIVGYITDKYGTKRAWHIFGTILVFLTFPLIFSICPFCDNSPNWWRMTFFSTVILIFQFGWPVVQITHLAMIPELSRTQRDRADLTATRYSTSVCSNVMVYIVTWAVLHVHSSYENKISPSDWGKFREISVIITLIGMSMTVLFHLSLSLTNYEYRRRIAISSNQSLPQSNNGESESLIRNENVEEPSTSSAASNDEIIVTLPRVNFFKSPLLYQNALLYVFSRLFLTTSLVYMPLWLNERASQPTPGNMTTISTELGNSEEVLRVSSGVENIAIIPLVSFIASFIASLIFKKLDIIIGHKIEYLIGSIISIIGCFWIEFAAQLDAPAYELYIVAGLFGAGSSITMIASLCITADMIGKHADQGGFIYSAVTFCDKLITGCVVVIIESFKCENRNDCPTYYRDVLSISCGVPAILGILTLLTFICIKPMTVIEQQRRRYSN